MPDIDQVFPPGPDDKTLAQRIAASLDSTSAPFSPVQIAALSERSR